MNELKDEIKKQKSQVLATVDTAVLTSFRINDNMSDDNDYHRIRYPGVFTVSSSSAAAHSERKISERFQESVLPEKTIHITV